MTRILRANLGRIRALLCTAFGAEQQAKPGRNDGDRSGFRMRGRGHPSLSPQGQGAPPGDVRGGRRRNPFAETAEIVPTR
jgi:hypothetical protein